MIEIVIVAILVMTPETRNAFHKSSTERSKARRKLRIEKFLTNQTFHDFYVVETRVNIDRGNTRCLYKDSDNHKDCGICQDCWLIYS